MCDVLWIRFDFIVRSGAGSARNFLPIFIAGYLYPLMNRGRAPTTIIFFPRSKLFHQYISDVMNVMIVLTHLMHSIRHDIIILFHVPLIPFDAN